MALKTLDTLIKLHKRRVDEMRREMNALEEERKQLISLSEKLKDERIQEGKLAAADAKMASFFGPYSDRIAKRLEGIAREVSRLDREIEVKLEAIREEFSEQKKYEIAREYAKKQQEIEIRRGTQQRFDEIGSQQFTRKQGDF